MDDSKKKRTTIKQVAKKAGVSVATVSRVFNNQELVREDKRQKVLNAIKELNYVPNPAARSLGKNQMYKIAVIAPNIINSALAETVRGIFDTCHPKGIDIILFNSNENSEVEKKSFLGLSNKLVEGAIFIAQCGTPLDFSNISQRMPIVLIERCETDPRVDRFSIDNEAAMDKIIGHLYELGHRKVAFLAGLEHSFNAQVRTDAFKKALEKRGLEFDENLVETCKFSFTGGRDAFTRLVESGKEFTAVIGATDMIAVGAVGAAIRMGYKVPEDISFAGYDGFPETESLVPAVTSLKYPAYEFGVMAAETVINRLEEGDIRPHQASVLDVDLVPRETTGKACGKRRDL